MNDKRSTHFYNMIDKFYGECGSDHVNTVYSIISGNSKISLRILDWFVTRYSNRKKIMIRSSDNYALDIHIDYKAQLKTYKKKYFDPFKRGDKFNYVFSLTSQRIDTTIGQLNFFRWIVSRRIIEYVDSHYDELLGDMKLSNRRDKEHKKAKKPKKKDNNFIGIQVSKEINDDDVILTLTFD